MVSYGCLWTFLADRVLWFCVAVSLVAPSASLWLFLKVLTGDLRVGVGEQRALTDNLGVLKGDERTSLF